MIFTSQYSFSALPAVVENIDLGRDCGLSPDINSSTCIFYPVKEEEREVPLAASQTGSSTETSRSSLLQTEHHAANSNCGESLHFYLQL